MLAAIYDEAHEEPIAIFSAPTYSEATTLAKRSLNITYSKIGNCSYIPYNNKTFVETPKGEKLTIALVFHSGSVQVMEHADHL